MNLALNDEILSKVDKSARYIGNEVNSVIKDKKDIKLRFAFCFPDVYEIGMSHLGIQILYEQFNKRPDVWCERVYSPWPDLHKIMKEQGIPLFAMESQESVRDFDFMGITLQYELCYTNVLGLFDLAGIPLYAKDRTENHPITICGGPCTANPRPVEDFFDIVFLGEGELTYDELFDLYIDCKERGISRLEFLREAAKLPGLYVPLLGKPEEKKDLCVCRLVDPDFASKPSPVAPVIPNVQSYQDRMVMEIQRGCIRGCRFCQAGIFYRPNRQTDLEVLKTNALELIKNTGYEEISLSSLSSSDYDELKSLLDFLIEECNENKINISLPSLRIDNFSLDIMSKIGDVRKSSITFAPEAGSQRMRDVINKNISHEEIINGAKAAFMGGWTNIKLYFMLGLPFETDEDILAIADIAEELAMLFFDTVPKGERNGRVQITVSTSFFVPKPFTPFQWVAMQTPEEYKRKASLLKAAIKDKPHSRCISYQWHSPEGTILEGILARGGPELGRAIRLCYEKGALFDAWSEFYDHNRWMESFKEAGIDVDSYTLREYDTDENLPWDFIDSGVTKAFLKREYALAKDGITTPDCKEKCSGCGCMKFNSGVCLDHKNKVS